MANKKRRKKKTIKTEENIFWKANSYVHFAWAIPWVGLVIIIVIFVMIFG